MDDFKIVRVACYARVSTLLGQDPQLQLINIRDFCKLKGYVIIDEFVDLGLSGKNEQRPQLLELMKGVRYNKYDAVITAGLDRLSRSTKHFLNLLDDLESNKTYLISLRENLDFTTATGRLVASVLAAVGSLEASLISERVRTALKAKKILAQQTGNGWRCGRKPIKKEIIDKVILMRKAGCSIRFIAGQLEIGKTTVERAIKSLSDGTARQIEPACPRIQGIP